MWNLNNQKQYSLVVYSEQEAHDLYGNLVVSPASQKSETIDDFNAGEVKLSNSEIVTLSSTDSNIELSLKDKIVTIVMDNSGSMTWNDANGQRFDIAKRFINKVGAIYPANTSFNIVKFGGREISAILGAALVENNPFDPKYNLQQTFEKDLFIDDLINFYGIRLVRRTDYYPLSPIDGDLVYEGIVSKFFDTDLASDTTYYYSAYSFNSDNHFSEPVRFKITPKNSATIEGVSSFYIASYKGSGPRSDTSSSGMWHFDENEGTYLHDFSGNGIDLVYESNNGQPYWIKKDDVISGESGIRLFSESGVRFRSITNTIVYESPLTVAFWVRTGISKKQFICGSIQDSLTYDWAVFVDTDKITISVNDGGSSCSSTAGSFIADNEWHHVVVSSDNTGSVSFYVDGIFISSGSIIVSSSGDRSFGNGYLFSIGGMADDFEMVGDICELDVYGENKDASFVGDIYGIQRQFADSDTDNGDRIISINYEIPSYANHIGGYISVVQNNDHIPCNEYDGEEIYDKLSSAGVFVSSIKNRFIPGETYYFRVFSRLNDVYSNIFDSPHAIVDIDGMSNEARAGLPVLTEDIPPVTELTISPGNFKNYLKWNFVNTNGLSEAIKVYCSESEFPVVSNEGVSGEEIFTGDVSEKSFVHKKIQNNKTYYYSVFSIDIYGRNSVVSNIYGTPSLGSDETLFPVDKIDGISAEMIDENSVRLFWNSIDEEKSIKAYFNEDIILYSKIVDASGSVVDVSSDVVVEKEISYKLVDNYAPDVFSGESTFSEVDVESIYNLVMSGFESGYSKGQLKLKLSGIGSVRLLRNIESVNIGVSFILKFKDNDNNVVYQYKTKKINIDLYNPLIMSLKNRDNRKIIVRKNNTISILNNNGIEEIEYDGAYAGTTKPFVVRVFLSYINNINISSSSIKYSIYESVKDLKTNDTAENSNEISSGTLSLKSENIEIVDGNGRPTGSYAPQSFVDIPLPLTDVPKNYLLYVKSYYRGFEIIKKIFVAYDGILKVELGSNVPVANGINSAQEFANVYMLDPDYPDDISRRSYPVDNTLVKWELTAISSFYPQRAIRSNDGISLSSGIYSYLTDGVADNVYIGPVFNPYLEGYDSSGSPVYEKHILKASIMYNGISASDSQEIEFVPFIESGQEAVGSYMLVEFENIKQKLYSDGEAFARMTVSHKPSVSSTPYSDCFRQCVSDLGKSIIDLERGQKIFINVSDPDVEIVSGTVVEVVDPYTGNVTLDTTNSEISVGSSSVNLSLDQDFTYIYFRLNKDETGQSSVGYKKVSSVCDCVNSQNIVEYKNEIVVSVQSTIVSGGQLISLFGGGTIETGIPPTIIVPIEPLNIQVVDRRISGIKTDNLIIDGVSENEFVLKITYAGREVNDGTVVSATVYNVINSSVTVSYNSSLSTVYSIDSQIDAFNKASYATLNINPLPKNSDFESIVKLDVSYLGRTASLPIIFSSSHKNSGSNMLFSSSMEFYDGVSWAIATSSSVARASSTSQIVNVSGTDFLYVIGGVNSSGTLTVNERYNTSTLLWETMSPMETGRFGCMSVVSGGYIYVIGGFETDIINNLVKVSRKIERYDTSTDTWLTLEDMPRIGTVNSYNYGVAYGAVLLYSNTIYVLSGIRDISEDGLTAIHNNRILSYSIGSDSWTYSDAISESSVPEYFTFSPAYGVSADESDRLLVMLGAKQYEDGKVKISCGAYSFNATDNSIEKENVINSSFGPKYYSASCSGGGPLFDSILMSGGVGVTGDFGSQVENFPTHSVPMGSFIVDDITITDNTLKAKSMSTISVIPSTENTYVHGGILPIQDQESFVKMEMTVVQSQLKLNGRQRIQVKIELLDVYGKRIVSGPVDVKVRGYLQFSNASEISNRNIQRDFVKNIIVLNDFNVTVTDAVGYFDIEPRSDDFLEGITNLTFEDGADNIRYKIVLHASIVDVSLQNDQKMSIVDVFSNIDQKLYDSAVDARSCIFIKSLSKGLDTRENFRLLINPVEQSNMIGVVCVSETAWMSFVDTISDSSLDYVQAASAIEALSSEKPFGPSPLYDGIGAACDFLSKEENDGVSKNLYIYTDGEESLSSFTENMAISSIKSVDSSDGFFPEDNLLKPNIINIRINDMYPVGIEKNGTTDDIFLNILRDTNGEVITFTSSLNEDNIIGFIIGDMNGSVSRGYASFVYDIEREVSMKSIGVNFTLPSNTGGFWKVSFGMDGHNFSYESNNFYPNASASFNSIQCRYLKFEFILTSGLSVDNTIANDATYTGGVPSVTSIDLEYADVKNDYIYIDSEEIGQSLDQSVITAEVETANTDLVKTNVGIANSDSVDWKNYQSDLKPSRVNCGKITEIKRDEIEVLDSVNGYIFKARYGSWDSKSNVLIKTLNNEVVDVSEYFLFPKDGIVVFNKRKTESLSISITNDPKIRIGVKISNSGSNYVYVRGVGMMYKENEI